MEENVGAAIEWIPLVIRKMVASSPLSEGKRAALDELPGIVERRVRRSDELPNAMDAIHATREHASEEIVVIRASVMRHSNELLDMGDAGRRLATNRIGSDLLGSPDGLLDHG